MCIRDRVKDAPIKVGMADTPSTPAFKMQQQQHIANIIGALAANPQAVMVLTPSFIESTDLEDREEVANTLRKLSGLPQPGDQQAQAQIDQQREQAQQQAAQVAAQHQQAVTELDASTARLNNAKADEISARNQGQQQVQQAPQATTRDQLIQQSLAEAMG